MIVGGLVAWFIGVDAERKSLEDIAKPLSARDTGGTRAQGARPRLPSTDVQGRRITPVKPEAEQGRRTREP